MELLYKKESYKIRGACFSVYNVLGGGIKEKIIQRALVSELESLGLVTEKEARIGIFYKGDKIGTYIPDLLINNKILIEIKSKPFVTTEDKKNFGVI